jgi:hypothetical protein
MKKNNSQIIRRKAKFRRTKEKLIGGNLLTKHSAAYAKTVNRSRKSFILYKPERIVPIGVYTKIPGAMLLNATESEIPFMRSLAKEGVRSFVIVFGPSKKRTDENEKSLAVAKKLIIPLIDEDSKSAEMIGKRVNKEISTYGFAPGEATIITRNIEGRLIDDESRY